MQKKYFPPDPLADKAKEIKNSKFICQKAIDDYVASGFCPVSREKIYEVLQMNSINCTPTFKVQFDEQYKHDVFEHWKSDWYREDKHRIIPSIVNLKCTE